MTPDEVSIFDLNSVLRLCPWLASQSQRAYNAAEQSFVLSFLFSAFFKQIV